MALLYRREVIPELVDFLRVAAMERPVDWLVPGFLVGGKSLRAFELIPNLFQHKGRHSTFDGNGKERAKMRSRTFKP